MNIFLHFQEEDCGHQIPGCVSIAEIAELSFKKHTKTGKLSSLPVDKVVDDVQTSPRAKSSWSNIVEQCDVQVTKECQLLCF